MAQEWGQHRPQLVRPWLPSQGERRAVQLFRDSFGCDPDGVWAAPGRVNLIGEHVDYNGGVCMPLALGHQTFVALRRRPDDTVRLVSGLDPTHPWSGTVDDIRPGCVTGWVAYAAGPLWSIRESGEQLRGFDAAIETCLPIGAGLSSSAAVECAVALALDDTYQLGWGQDDAGRARLAAWCVRAENDVAGAPTGGMDQAISLRATAGHALLYGDNGGIVRQIPLELGAAGLCLVVIDTRAEHSLADGQYADRRATCGRASERLGVRRLADVEDLDTALRALTEPVERRRVRHVATEISRVHRFVELVSGSNLPGVGLLMDESHESLRSDFEVSCFELDVAVAAARVAGAVGARMTGGGFGGSAIALTAIDGVDQLIETVVESFAAARLRSPQFLVVEEAASAGRRIG